MGGSALESLLRSKDLAAADEATLERLSTDMVLRSYDSDDVVFREGDPSDTTFVVESGRIRLTSARPDGTPQFLADMGLGELLGEMTAVIDRPRSATATTLRPASAWEMPATSLHRRCATTPGCPSRCSWPLCG